MHFRVYLSGFFVWLVSNTRDLVQSEDCLPGTTLENFGKSNKAIRLENYVLKIDFDNAELNQSKRYRTSFTELAQYDNIHVIHMIPDINILLAVGYNHDGGLQFLRYTAFTDGVTVVLNDFEKMDLDPDYYYTKTDLGRRFRVHPYSGMYDAFNCESLFDITEEKGGMYGDFKKFCLDNCKMDSGHACIYDPLEETTIIVEEEPTNSAWETPQFSFSCNIIQMQKSQGYNQTGPRMMRIWYIENLENGQHVQLSPENAACFFVDGMDMQIFNTGWNKLCKPLNFLNFTTVANTTTILTTISTTTTTKTTVNSPSSRISLSRVTEKSAEFLSRKTFQLIIMSIMMISLLFAAIGVAFYVVLFCWNPNTMKRVNACGVNVPMQKEVSARSAGYSPPGISWRNGHEPSTDNIFKKNF